MASSKKHGYLVPDITKINSCNSCSSVHKYFYVFLTLVLWETLQIDTHAQVTAGKSCTSHLLQNLSFFFFFSFILFFISWRLITLQYCSGFCHTLKLISHGFTCVPNPNPPSHLPLHLIPLGLPSAPGPSTCLMHPTWAGDLFHPR